jgi:hypothetical protein
LAGGRAGGPLPPWHSPRKHSNGLGARAIPCFQALAQERAHVALGLVEDALLGEIRPHAALGRRERLLRAAELRE